MKLIDYVCERTGETKEYIVSLACPSSFGPEYDGYDENCENKDCEKCWEQEISIWRTTNDNKSISMQSLRIVI